MLTLGRKNDQTVKLFTEAGEVVTIKVRSNAPIRLDIDAPQSVRIVRGELELKERAA